MHPIRSLLTIGLLAGSMHAADSPVPPGTPEDADLARSAYFTLQRDVELADRNIGVRAYRGGIVLLWGQATPADVERARAILKGNSSVTRVVDGSEAVTTAGPVARRLAEGPKPAPPPPPAAVPVAAPPPEPVHRVTSAKPTDRAPAAVLLQPVGDRTSPDFRAIQQARTSSPRFNGLRLELRDGRIVIDGEADPADAWDLAQTISPLAGGHNVVVGNIRRR